MMQRILCILIGYGFGCILTAEIVAHFRAGKPCREIGTGNPGMANIMTELGFWPGAAVLAGDAAKTAAACLLAAQVFPQVSFRAAALYAGLGAALGHDFPFWHRFRGGKSVAVTCTALFCADPLWGILADAAGMLVVFSTGWLPLGAVVIPAVYMIMVRIMYGTEETLIAAAFALLMLFCHRHGLARIFAGTERPRARLFRRGGNTEKRRNSRKDNRK